MIETQDKTITNLLKAVKEQHDQLDHQKMKIKNLEEKVNDCSLLSPVSNKLQDFPMLCQTVYIKFFFRKCMEGGDSAFSRVDNII